MTGRIICLGDVMLDVLAVLPGPLQHASDTPAPITLGHGGSAANTAAWLGFCGVPSYFAGRVGDDAFGREAVQALVEHGVSQLVSVDPVAATGVCIVLVSPGGERTMVPSSGANLTIRPAHLGADLLASGDHLHVSGYSLLNEGSREAALYALRLATSAGASVSVDAASAGPIRTVGGAAFLDWLPEGTLLLANADEARALSPNPPDVTPRANVMPDGTARATKPGEGTIVADETAGGTAQATEPDEGTARANEPEQGTADLGRSDDAALSYLVRRGLTVVLKQGGSGAVVARGAERFTVPATPVAALDTTGAGDAFAAGVLAALQRGCDLHEAVHEGNLLGARAVGVVGARPCSPTR